MSIHRGASEEAWKILEKVRKGEDLTTRETVVSTDTGPVLHVLDGVRHRHVLLPIAPDEKEYNDKRSRGVSVATRILQTPDGREGRYIDVECRETSLNDLFSTVCDEILSTVESSSSSVGNCLAAVLDRWRELLGPASNALLAEQAVKGLLAELHVLEAIAETNPELALKVWTGVDKHRHDFTGVTASCEVKASTLADEVKIHVNGLRQLTPPPSASLHLVIERLERVPEGGDSLPEAIERIEARGVHRHALLSALLKVGVRAADIPDYGTVRFRTLERRIYEVDENFPHLGPEMLVGKPAADRISNVEYVLNLGGEPPVALDADALNALPVWLLNGVEIDHES